MGLKTIYLLDTNIISEGIKSQPNTKVISNMELFSYNSAIGAPSWYEVQKGLEFSKNDDKRETLDLYYNNYISSLYPVISYDEHAAKLNAHIFAKMKRNGTPVDIIDMQLASIALANNLILVTRNTKHFEPIQKEFSLCVENWFED